MKTKRHVRICNNFLKLGINETIGHVNEEIQSEGLEINNITNTCADKDKQTLREYGIKDEETTSSTSKKKYNVCDGYVCIYECGKKLIIFNV